MASGGRLLGLLLLNRFHCGFDHGIQIGVTQLDAFEKFGDIDVERAAHVAQIQNLYATVNRHRMFAKRDVALKLLALA